jgi:hypothetical protein
MWEQFLRAEKEMGSRARATIPRVEKILSFLLLLLLLVLFVFVMEGGDVIALAVDVVSPVASKFDDEALRVTGAATLVLFVIFGVLYFSRDFTPRALHAGYAVLFAWLLIVIPVLMIWHSDGVRLAIGIILLLATIVSLIVFCLCAMDTTKSASSAPPLPKRS